MDNSSSNHGASSVIILDIFHKDLIEAFKHKLEPENGERRDENIHAPLLYAYEKLQALSNGGNDSNAFLKCLLPQRDGTLIQSDFVQRRLVDCVHVSSVEDFVLPGQQVRAVPQEVLDSKDLKQIAPYIIATILVAPPTQQSIQSCSQTVDEELEKRLSYPWLSQMPVSRRRIVLIGGRKLSALEGYTTAAASLNIAIVVLDEATHWLADPKWAHLREDFVPFDMTADDNMPRRIADFLSKYPQRIDGLMTIEEHLLTLVSKAAALMNLPTSPPESVAMAQNKYQTRLLDKTVFSSAVSSATELENMIQTEGHNFNYPLIVKPSKGWASEGVWKVFDESDLRDKVNRLWKDSFAAWHGREVVIETFIDGPEVDVNIVLLQGEILFFEVNDDFPSPGDKQNAPRFANFVEDSNMLPSKLPSPEIHLLKRSLHQYLLQANFRSGVFHIEARLRGSSSRYAEIDGILDLVTSEQTGEKEPHAFLLEINPRAPGMQEINATARAYGVSYYTLSLLAALADSHRTRALSIPFLGGAQYHLQILFISAERGGLYRAGDVCEALFRRRPELRECVVECESFLTNGQEVPDPETGSMTWVAYFLVCSRVSRGEALRAGERVRGGVKAYMDEFEMGGGC
ncbi:MAG: hypothetical protein Q9195_006186 [Heterodermia aff. obscurata]